MPLYKLWRDSRARFLFTLAALMIVSAASIFYNARTESVVLEAKNFHEAAMRTFQGPLFLFWSFAAAFLGLGGLLREKSTGTVDYTLSLPVSRTIWFWHRAWMGALQALLVAIAATATASITAAAFGGGYPLTDAVLHGLRLGLGGMVFYAAGLAASAVFAGEFTSTGIAVALVFAIQRAPRIIEPLKGFSIQDAIMTSRMIDMAAHLPRGALPWSGILLSLAASLTLTLLAWRATLRQDF